MSATQTETTIATAIMKPQPQRWDSGERNHRSRTGCLTCRDRHVKCDEEQPICDGCRKQNRDCVWGWNVKFVHGVRTTRQTANDEWDGSSDYRFRKGQRWVPVHVTPKSFVDETNEVRSWFARPSSPGSGSGSGSGSAVQAALATQTQTQTQAQTPLPLPLLPDRDAGAHHEVRAHAHLPLRVESLSPTATRLGLPDTPGGGGPTPNSYSIAPIRSHSFSSQHRPLSDLGPDVLSPHSSSIHDPFSVHDVAQTIVNLSQSHHDPHSHQPHHFDHDLDHNLDPALNGHFSPDQHLNPGLNGHSHSHISPPSEHHSHSHTAHSIDSSSAAAGLGPNSHNGYALTQVTSNPSLGNSSYEPARPALESHGHGAYETDTEHSRLSTPREAYLLQHYIRSRSPLLDICDPNRHFGRTVPELATRSPLLLAAVLAVSAQHLASTRGWEGEWNESVAEGYHERCVELLIPLLDELCVDSSPSGLSGGLDGIGGGGEVGLGDEIVAATVLLRNYEQMASSHTGFDMERHLSGASAFINSATLSCAAAGGLRQASFWVFVRQDLDVALSQQRPLRLNLEQYASEMEMGGDELGVVLQRDDDWAWANRIVWLTAEVVAFAFADAEREARGEGAGSGRRGWWAELRQKARGWWEGRPVGFGPLFVGRGEGEGGENVFPVVYYSQPWHALGMQYYHIIMILLAISDTSRLKIGFGHRASLLSLSREIAHHSDLLFGTAVTTSDSAAKITACNAISVCAPWITDRRQQECIVQMMRGLERDVAWPTRGIEARAMEEWEWGEEERRGVGAVGWGGEGEAGVAGGAEGGLR